MRKTEECRDGDCLNLSLSEAFKKDFQREVMVKCMWVYGTYMKELYQWLLTCQLCKRQVIFPSTKMVLIILFWASLTWLESAQPACAIIHALTSSALLPWIFYSFVFFKAFALVQPYQPPNTNRTFTLCSLPSGLLFSFHIYILSFKCAFLIGKSDCTVKMHEKLRMWVNTEWCGGVS